MKRGTCSTLACALSLVALCSAGCVSSRKGLQRAAASHLAATATSYNLAIEQAQDEMLLMNVIRAKDHNPMYITDASKVTGTVKLDLSLGVTVPTPASIKPNIDYSSSPAMDVNLLNAQDFMNGFLSPIPQDFFVYYWDQGWPAEFLLHLLVLRVDVYKRAPDPDCGKAADLEAELEQGPEEKAIAAIASAYAPEYASSPICSISNHPDAFDKGLTQLVHFANLVHGLVSGGRPRLQSEAAQKAIVGPALAPQKLDELVAVATAAGLSLHKTSSEKFQLQQPIKLFSLVPSKNASPFRADENPCAGERSTITPESPDLPDSPRISWSALTNVANNQVLMRSRCGKFAYALKLRSPEGVLYYLGQLARLEEQQSRALLIHVCDFGQGCGPKPSLRPLFVALEERAGCSRGIIQVQSSDKRSYLIPRDTVSEDLAPSVDSIEEKEELKLMDTRKQCSSGRSMMALDMAAQLIGLQKTAKDFSTTTTVKLVGQ
jgi:hypothetical protein